MTANTQQANLPGYDENGYPVVSTHDPAIVSGGTDVEIQAALDALTSGRTWKEKVILKGQFTVTAKITIPSYTILEIQGKLTGGIAGDGIIENDDVAGGNTDIEIIGGYFDCELTATSSGIKFDNVDNFIIRGTHIVDAGFHCIDISGCTNFSVKENYVANAGDDGISVLWSSSFSVNENIIEGGSNNGAGGGSSGIEIEDGCHDFTISNNTINNIQDTGTSGIHIVTDPGSTAGCMFNMTVTGNVVNDGDGVGIRSAGNKVPITISSMSGLNDGGTVTVTCSSAHGLSTTKTCFVYIDDVDDAGIGLMIGLHQATVTSTTEFTVPVTDNGTYTSGASVYFDHVGVTLTANSVSDTTEGGMSLSRNRGGQIASNAIVRSGDIGINDVTGNVGISIFGNEIVDPQDIGIVAGSSTRTKVSNNDVINAGRQNSNTYSIQANAGTETTITYNNCIGQGTNGAENLTRGIQMFNTGDALVFGNNVTTCRTTNSYKIEAVSGDVVGLNPGGNNVTITANGAHNVNPSVDHIKLNNSTAAQSIAATIADAVDHEGFLTIETTSAPDTTHTVTLSSGTWDGANTIATFNANADKITVYFDPNGEGTIINNVGAVAFS